MTDSLSRYPRNEGGLVVRPLQAKDVKALADFFKRLPLEERQLFKHDVTQDAVVQRWIRSLDYEKVLPLVVLDGARIVADATLHRERRGWGRHVAKVRVALDPEYRRRGLGRLLVREFIELSPAMGIAILDAEVLSLQTGAFRLFESLGFHCVATLPQHAFDFAGRVHDIVVYSYTVTPPEKFTPGASLAEDEADIGGG
jgi:ribosomal protein S18 acetylase RimI-like enzyme